MTTNDATPREARVYVAKTIEFIDRNKPQELIDVNWELRKDRNSGLRSQETLLFLADNAIDAHNEYLWSRADDPDSDVLGIMTTYIKDARNHPDVKPEVIAEDAITAMLTALIGPNPNGGSDE